MVENTRDLVEQDADVLAAQWHFEAEQLLDRQHEGVLLAHRRDVVETVEIRNRLEVGLVLDKFLGAAMQQADMRIEPLDDLAVHFHHEPQHAMRRRMLRPEVERHRLDLDFGHQALPSAGFVAFSSPGSCRTMPSHGLSKSNVRNSCRRFTRSYTTRFCSLS